jgi:hypothetical protein
MFWETQSRLRPLTLGSTCLGADGPNLSEIMWPGKILVRKTTPSEFVDQKRLRFGVQSLWLSMRSWSFEERFRLDATAPFKHWLWGPCRC